MQGVYGKKQKIKQRIKIESASTQPVKANNTKTGCCRMETGLGNLCRNKNKTIKTGQEGAGSVQVQNKEKLGL